ncbi:MAG: carbohydrate-binding protein, partial [Verrucomicrobiota bacterium]|nr:carbohydrate-binding protein [Verrucomicrobiota bacterium]
AYSDTTAENLGKAYRVDEAVDVSVDQNAGNNHTVGWTLSGEWLNYTVNVTSGGTYRLDVRVAGVGTGGQFRVRLDGEDKTGILAVPDTRAWDAYQTVQKTGISIPATGIHTVQVEMVSTGSGGYVGAFDHFAFFLTAPSSRRAAVEDGAWTSRIVEVLADDEHRQPTAGWHAVDGDMQTLWQSANAEGAWLALVYDPARDVHSVQVEYEGTEAVPQLLYSLDAEAWEELVLPLTNGPVRLNYLWILFPNAGDAPPAIREIHVE